MRQRFVLIFVVIVSLCGGGLPLHAAPLKVLVIGGPGASYVTQPDAVLAEMLGRSKGWDTRYTEFFTTQDETPVATRQMGKANDIQSVAFAEILTLLNDWRPDVTMARLPRDDFKALPVDIQKLLVDRVKNGMGLVVWSTDHGSVDFHGKPIQDVLPGSGFGGDYSGGYSEPTWKWSAHRLNFGLPLDQIDPESFYDISGKASDFNAIDLAPPTDRGTGFIRVRDAGRGRVVMLGCRGSIGLGAISQVAADEAYQLADRPDHGETHLHLIERSVQWAAGDKASDRIAVNIPPLAAEVKAGHRQDLAVQFLNETGALQQAEVWARFDGGKPFKIAAVTAGAGLTAQHLFIPIPPVLHGVWLPLEITLRRGGLVLGSPPASATRYLKIDWPVAVSLSADRRGAARGETVTLTARMKLRETASNEKIRLVWTVNDYQRRVLDASEQNIVVAPGVEAQSTFHWTLPRLDTTHYRYILRATAMRDNVPLGDAILPIFRAEPFHLNEGIYHGPWTSLANFPEAMLPNILDLYADAGMRSVDTNLSPQQIYYSEQRNWRGYTESMYGAELGDWGILNDDEALQKAREEVASFVQTNAIKNSAAFPVLSLGEEAPLTLNGRAICDIWDEKSVDPAGLAKIRQGYIEYLKNTYGTLDKLNEQWDKTYTSWDQVEMVWKYFNFYYADRARPDKGITNVSQAVDQSAYMRFVWQKVYDARTKALREALPTTRTMFSTGDFFSAKQDIPDQGDNGHTFTLAWAFYDDIQRIHDQLSGWLLGGTTMAAYWFDFPLSFNPDLTHTRASMFQRAEVNRQLQRAPVILQTGTPRITPEVAVMRPSSPYSGEFYTLLQNISTFLPTSPETAWKQMLLISGIFPDTQITPDTKLVVLPLAVNLSAAQAEKLTAFVRAGGTLVTTCGLAEYNLRGKPYPQYPGAGMSDLLGFTLKRNYSTSAGLRWTISAWPQGAVPQCGTLYSTGRDDIEQPAADVKILGKYADGVPALLFRKVGAGQVLHFNGVYSIPYTYTSEQMPFWSDMGNGFVHAVLGLAGVKSQLNVVDGDGKLLDNVAWNVVGAGTDAPGPGDVEYVRIAGSLTPKFARIVSRQPIAAARDALWDHELTVRKVTDPVDGDSWIVPFERGPGAAHFIALFPYRPAKLSLAVRPAKAGSQANIQVEILDSTGRLTTGHHAIVAHAELRGMTVSQMGQITGRGTIALPIGVRDSGDIVVHVDDLTAGLHGTAHLKIAPSALANRLPDSLPPVKHGMPPRHMDDDEVIASLKRLAHVYASGPSDVPNGDEIKWRLGYYTFMIDDSRHAIVERGLAQNPWHSDTLLAVLSKGARFFLTGEDLGIDPLQGQRLTDFDRFAELAPIIKKAVSAYAVAGTPDQVVFTFNGGGRLLLDRRSFDYWPSDDPVVSNPDVHSDSRYIAANYGGGSQQFLDEYKDWWQGLKSRGLFDDHPHPESLMPLPAAFALRGWWLHGFSARMRQSIQDAGDKLPFASRSWKPGTAVDNYQVGDVLFSDDFKRKNSKWTFEGGVWQWKPGKLIQATTWLMVAEGAGWGGRAIMKDVADPTKGPILIEANGRITEAARYGSFGVGGGYIPGNPNSGLECATSSTSLFAGSSGNPLPKVVPVEDVVHSWADDFQFVVLIDGTTIKAKVWNFGSQTEPADWQFSGTVPNASLGSALLLHTESIALWNNVCVWRLNK